MAFTTDPDRTLGELRNVKTVSADSSSLIYARKCGVFAVLARDLEVLTVAGVVREVGFPVPGIRILGDEGKTVAVDDQVLALAESKQVPLLTEDRKLFMKAEDRGVEAYNMLLMLELLLLRGSLSLVEWDEAHKKLLAAANYSPWVVDAGTRVHWAVRKEIG